MRPPENPRPDAPPVATAAAIAAGAATATVGSPAAAQAAGDVATGAAGAAAAGDGGTAEADAVGGQVVLGVHLSGTAGQLLARLKREREESMDYERKLTQALLDL